MSDVIDLPDDVPVIADARSRIRCQHSKFVVDETLNTIECGICQKELNPIWVMMQMTRRESRANRRVKILNQIAEKANKKNRCKCQHCGKMTRIQR